jgi:hypothetical protein
MELLTALVALNLATTIALLVVYVIERAHIPHDQITTPIPVASTPGGPTIGHVQPIVWDCGHSHIAGAKGLDGISLCTVCYHKSLP